MSEKDAATGLARADFCRFIAACYYEPGPEFAEEKLFPSMVAAAARLDPTLTTQAQRLGECFASETIESLLVDYTRLFLGPADMLAKPYASVWLTGEKTLMQESTLRTLHMYRQAGFEMDETFRELPDHIAVELEFLYLLIYKFNEAQVNGETNELASLAALRATFLNDHLCRWLSHFTAAVRSGARTAFYRELADITERFVALELQREGG